MRDPERAPIAAALQKTMREKAAVCIRTLALAADEAHRQIPIDERDRHLHCCQHRAGRCSSHQHCGNTWHCFSILFLVPSTVSGKSQCPHMAHAGGWRCTISNLGALNNTVCFTALPYLFRGFRGTLTWNKTVGVLQYHGWGASLYTNLSCLVSLDGKLTGLFAGLVSDHTWAHRTEHSSPSGSARRVPAYVTVIVS